MRQVSWVNAVGQQARHRNGLQEAVECISSSRLMMHAILVGCKETGQKLEMNE
jgi:hypothetical protein